MPFRHDIAGGQGNLIISQLQSPNFDLAAQTGWAILKNGDAYFFNITAAGTVTSNTVIVKGSGDGLFVYDGAPAKDSLILSISSASGTDAYGNDYSGPGMALSFGVNRNEILLRPDLNAMLIYAAA